MKLRRLEVEDFRGIRGALIEFGPGLTVLHGPNELGKSTLVEAIRAALFVQTNVQAGNEHVTWGSSTPACVSLTFEHEGKLWRVSKQFGHRPYAKLESSDRVDAPHFHEVLTGKGVEGRLRELLAWGIAPPGGKGAAPKAESFLLTALLGRQGEAQKILDTSLDDDRDSTGRSMVTRAMGALDKDPLVSHILEQLRTRVEAVFTSTGSLKTAADSPLVKLQQRLRSQEARLFSLQDDDRKGRSIQADVVKLQDERQRLLGELEAADANWRAATAQAERATQRAKLQGEIDELQRQLLEADRLATELTALEGRLVAGRSSLSTLKEAESVAAAALEATRQQLQAAAEAVARETAAAEQSGRVQEAAHAQRRAELEAGKARGEAHLKDIEAAERAVFEAAALEQQLAEVSVVEASASEAATNAAHALEHATLRARLDALHERQEAVMRAAEQLAGAQQREQAARHRLQAAAARVAEAEGRRDRREEESNSEEIEQAEAELLLLRAVDAHLVIDALRAEVRALDEAAARGRTLRASAEIGRADASAIEQRVASHVLPTREQIVAWRALEDELHASSLLSPAAPTSPMMPVAAAFAGTFAVVATAALLGLDWPRLTAVLAGLVAACIAGGATWVALQGRIRTQSAEYEQRARRRDRWTQEVEPSLRAAGLMSLADYEYALADVERRKADARRLRDQADRDDHDAAEAERRAAPRESRRELLARLEREAPTVDAAAVAVRATAFGGDANAVRVRLTEIQQALEAARDRLRADAAAAVTLAIDQRHALQAEYDAATRDVTVAETALAFARQQTDPDDGSRLLARLADMGQAVPLAASVAEASRALEEAKLQQMAASAKLDGLRARLAEVRPRVDRRVRGLGGDLTSAREQAQQSLAAIAAELACLGMPAVTEGAGAAPVLDGTRNRHETLTRQFARDKATLESATERRSAAEGEVAVMETDAAARRGQLTAINRPALESRLQQAASDAVFQFPDGLSYDLAAAHATVEGLQQQLERCTNDLSHAKGQLHLIAGHVGSERLAQQQEAVHLARAEVLECEQTERAAFRLLREIEAVEAERATHLGRALAGPITEAFRALTGGRYGPISVAPDLKTEHVDVRGAARPLEHLSVGTREQLATLLRLAIAGCLRTAVVLDDQLVHSDSERLAWFSERLRASAREHDHQVIVFTCRPGDYLRGDASDAAVTVVDLAALVSR